MSDANRLQFVDTNILIYAHDESAGDKHTRAKALLKELWEDRTGCVSIQVLQEFYVNVTQKVAIPLTAEAAAQIIADLSVWQIHQPNVDDVLDAIRLQARHRLSFWDALIVTSAVALSCQIIWSEDLNPGQRFATATVTNPFV
jgi:predicted nucleic acid-binding protein